MPFERFPEVRGKIRDRIRWSVIDDEWSYFQGNWKPKKWATKMRCIIFRHRVRKPIKGPIQTIRGISGATELGDRTAILVIDVSSIVADAVRRREAA